MSSTRQDAENRLGSLVAAWIKTREEKTGVVAEYNKDIKALEESIEALSAEIQGGAFQPSLPFGEPKTPAITLAEDDPDAKAAKVETQPEVSDSEDPTACVECGHAEGVHGDNGQRRCMRQDCKCGGYSTLDGEPLIVEPTTRQDETDAELKRAERREVDL